MELGELEISFSLSYPRCETTTLILGIQRGTALLTWLTQRKQMN